MSAPQKTNVSREYLEDLLASEVDDDDDINHSHNWVYENTTEPDYSEESESVDESAEGGDE